MGKYVEKNLWTGNYAVWSTDSDGHVTMEIVHGPEPVLYPSGEAPRDSVGGKTGDTLTSPEPKTPVDTVVDQLDSRVVSSGDRQRLGRALDRANAPNTGRTGPDGSDAAIGSISRRGL